MKIKIITSIVILLFIGGCTKDTVQSPAITVSTTAATYNVGKPVTFQITGNPDIIYFYSGEIGKRYSYAGRISAPGTPKFQFTSLRANGIQDGSLQLMVSSDFPGITIGDTPGTLTKISSTTWTNITSRAVLSQGTSVASGAIDLTDFAQLGKPVIIAFKYLAQAGSIQNKWTISSPTLTNTLADGTVYTLANTTSTVIANYGVSTVFSPGWVFYTPVNNFFWSLSSTNLIITGATTAAAATTPAEAWTIMGPIDLTNVAPDVGIQLKGVDTRLNSYTYTYNTAGTYTATFVGAANNVYVKTEETKQIQITVN